MDPGAHLAIRIKRRSSTKKVLIRQELITKNRVKVSLFVNKLKIPFWIIVAVIFALEFTSSMLRGLYYPLGTLTTLTGVVYIVSSLAISLLYFISGIKEQAEAFNEQLENNQYCVNRC